MSAIATPYYKLLWNPFARLETNAEARFAARAGAAAAGMLGLVSGLSLLATIFGHGDLASQFEQSKTIVCCLFGIAAAAILGAAINGSQELWASITLAVFVSLYLTAAGLERGLAALWTINVPIVIWTILNVRGTLYLAREARGGTEVLSRKLQLFLTCGASLLLTITGLTVWTALTSPLKPRSSETKQALSVALPEGSTVIEARRLLRAQGMRCRPLKHMTFNEDVSDRGDQKTRPAADYLFCDGWNNVHPLSTWWQIAIYGRGSMIDYIAVSTSRFRP